MNVLMYLAERAGTTVTHEALIAEFWRGTISSPNAVHKCVAELRHAFGSGERAYIETVPKRGYRLVAPVEPLTRPMGGAHSANGGRTNGGAPTNGESPTKGESAAHVLQQPNDRASTSAATLRSRWLAAVAAAAVLVVAWAFVQGQRAQGDVITLAGRSAVILPALRDLSSIDLHTLDAIRERVIQVVEAAHARVQMARRIRWPGEQNDAAGWNADYAVQIELTDTNDRLGGSLEILPAASGDPSRREQFDAASRTALTDILVTHASEDLLVLLDRDEVAKMRDQGTTNVDAYRSAREGDAFQRVATMESQLHAEQLFRRAVTEDPQFGYGFIQLAAVHAWMAYMASDTAEHEHQRGLLQALLREASQGYVETRFLRLIEHLYRYASVTRAVDAEKYWHEELVKNPVDLDALIGYSEVLMGAKLIDEGQRYVERGLQQPLPYGYEDGLRRMYIGLAQARGDLAEAVRLQKLYMESRPDDTLAMYATAENLATLKRFDEADVYVARLEAADPRWGFGARTVTQALKGDLPKGSEVLRQALENPLGSIAMRSDVCFILGDVECGVRYGRQMESSYLRLQWVYEPMTEQHWPRGVVDDRRYQDGLEAHGIGRTWRIYVREEAQKLAAITGIDVTTPPPPEDVAVR